VFLLFFGARVGETQVVASKGQVRRVSFRELSGILVFVHADVIKLGLLITNNAILPNCYQ
jgi:hypothetical protein